MRFFARFCVSCNGFNPMECLPLFFSCQAAYVVGHPGKLCGGRRAVPKGRDGVAVCRTAQRVVAVCQPADRGAPTQVANNVKSWLRRRPWWQDPNKKGPAKHWKKMCPLRRELVPSCNGDTQEPWPRIPISSARHKPYWLVCKRHGVLVPEERAPQFSQFRREHNVLQTSGPNFSKPSPMRRSRTCRGL